MDVTGKTRCRSRKLRPRAIVDSYMVWCLDTTPAEIAAVFRIEDEAGIGFWGGPIVAAARKAGAARILSEDLNPGQIIAGVQIENPFSTQQATSYE